MYPSGSQPGTVPSDAPDGYPRQDQNAGPANPPFTKQYPQQQYGQYQYQSQPYTEQPYYQQAYNQPPPRPYSYPPVAASTAGYNQNVYASSGAPGFPKPSYQGYYANPPFDEETGRITIQAAMFAEKTVRLAFVRKVFALLSMMMAVTVGVVCLFMFQKDVQNYLRANTWTFWASFGVSFGVLIYLSCSPSAAKKYPTNYIFLGIFTICQSVLIGTVTMYSARDAVLIAAACTLGVTVTLTLFATQSKFDFTMIGGVLVSILITVLIASLIGIFIRSKWFHIVLAGVGALLFAAFLIYDIQLIMGKGKHAISPDEYVFAALALYLDIINIFLYILTIVGLVKDD